MKKFLAVFDGFKMSESTMKYAIELSIAANAHLVGLFLEEFVYRSYNVYKVVTTEKEYETVLKQLDEKDRQKRDLAVLQFEAACQKAGIHFSVHRDKQIALQEVKHESMFADLIIISKWETFTKYKEKLPTYFIKELLIDMQCPVLLVPAAYRPLSKINLLYNGSPAAVYAIKMFSYLFDNLQTIPAEVLTVKDDNLANLHLPDNKLMKEFMKRHFPKAVYSIQKGDAENTISNYLKNHPENELVVLGAYQRSDLSRFFKSSMADVLMKKLDTPLFIAHHK
jgi:nucleotide-binding universal stress UspA family protein